jgi:transposase
MTEYILAACDVHDKTLVLKIARGMQAPQRRTFGNHPAGRAALVAELNQQAAQAGGAQVVFAYEASGQGFGLYDELTQAGFTGYVLAPTRIERSARHRRDKNDQRDALRILELLRGHVLAGNPLPAVWIPDRQTRDDRELLRARLDAGEKLTQLKTQIQCLLKRHEVRRPGGVAQGWTSGPREWLEQLPQQAGGPLGPSARMVLKSLLRQMAALEGEIDALDRAVARLARTRRYARTAKALDALPGVGLLAAMVFLTELGDLSRFQNRRQVAAYLGLVPSAHESGQQDDHKGHITHQGPWRVRKVLCQAFWALLRAHPEGRAIYERQVRRNPKHKKIAVVAGMRRLAVILWHKGLAAGLPPGQRAAG